MNKLISLLKKTLKIISWIVIGFVILFFFIAVIIQLPFIQTKIVRYATTFVSDKTHTKVEIKNIHISFPKSVNIQGLYLEDINKDTLLFAGKLQINISFKDLFNNKITLNSVSLEEVIINLKRIKNDSLFNYNFLITSFSDTLNKKNLETNKKSNWIFSINNVSLKKIRINYDDKYGGTKAAINLNKLKLKMQDLDLVKSVYHIDNLLIEGLTAKVILKESEKTEEKDSKTSILPEISATKIEISNSKLFYTNSSANQFLTTNINQLKLKKSVIDIQKQLISSDYISISKTEISYFTKDAESNSDSIIYTTKSSSEKNNWTVSVKKIDLQNNSLVYKIINKPTIENVFDVNNLDYKRLTLSAKNLYYSTYKTKVNITKFSAVDQNNFSINRFETDFIMDSHSITANKLKVETNNSSIDADINLQYTSLKSLTKYLPFIRLNANMRNITINNSDILYFSPQLKNQIFFKNTRNITKVSGKINGTVNNLKGENLIIETGVNTYISSNFSIYGLPDIKNTYFHFPNLKINSSRGDIAFTAGTLIPKSIELPEKINLDIIYKGQLKDFESAVKMQSSYGNAFFNASINKTEHFKAYLSISGFDLGKLLKNKPMYGPVSLIAETEGQGLDENSINAKLIADVSQIYLNQYNYHNLKINGSINGKMFDGKINLKDENAAFDFEGLVNFNPNEENYKFFLNLHAADLRKLNFSKDDIRIGFKAESHLKGKTLDKINGNAWMSNIIVASGVKKYLLDSILIDLINHSDKSMIFIRSAIADIIYNGSSSPIELPKISTNFITKYFPFKANEPLNKQNNDFTIDIHLRNHPILTEVLFPDLEEFNGGIIKASFESRKNEMKINAVLGKIVYGTTEIKDFAINIDSDSTILNYKILSNKISNNQIKLDNLSLKGKITDKTIFAGLTSIDETGNKKLLVNTHLIKENENYKLAFDPKDFYIMNNRWEIAEDNYIEFGKQGFLVHHLFINNTESEINITSVNNKFNDDLTIEIKNFKLEDISGIIEKDSSFIKGNFDGNVLLKRINNTYGVIADARIRNLLVRNVAIGNLSVKAKNPIAEKFEIDLNLTGMGNNLTANGYFYPKGGDNSVNIKTAINSLSMKTVEAFSMGTITKASGILTGSFLIDGKISEPDITGELFFNNTFVTPSAINHQIQLKHESIKLKEDGFYFNSFTILDADQNTAIIDGSIQMNQFKNYKFALQLNAKDFLLLNTTDKDNKEFYGKMIIDSKVEINGPMSLPVVFAKIKMKKGSNFTFAVAEKQLTTDKGEDVVEFDNILKINPILNKIDKKENQKSGLTGFDISSIIEIDKEATLKLLMDPSSSDSLVVKGDAALSFSIDRSGKMSLTGAYNLNDGSYIVSLESILKRRFSIDKGSTIIWNGDPLDADISINATYSVRTSPYELVADQMTGLSESEKSGYKQRYPFLVILKLRGQILKPEINFEIQLAPENKGILGGAVNAKLTQLNQDISALNKQVFALLVLNRFIQENPLQSESTGTLSTVRSTVGKLLSTQLNQWSSKIVSGVELNFDIQSYEDYQSGQAEGRTQVDIGVKKQLFNERLTVQIGGTVDVEGEQAKQNSASNLTSDVTVEYKFTKDGRYRLKAFRHNQYEGAIDGQLVETGIGVLYVRDFNNWIEFFKSPKSKIDKVIKVNTYEK